MRTSLMWEVLLKQPWRTSVRLTHAALFQWTINSSTLMLDWGKPTLERVSEQESIFPTPYNVVKLEVSSSE